MMHAYDKDYLYHAQRNFAHMVDFATNVCDYDLDEFFNMFLASNVCSQYENGNPAYIAGKTGCELTRLIVSEIRNREIPHEDVMYMDKSPEYWLGWALSYYAWEKNCKFKYILEAIPAGDMIGMYDMMHEADITKFVFAMDERLSQYYTETTLKRMRIKMGMSQSELAEKSGVNIKVIQGYEQRLRDINKAQMIIVSKLASALGCGAEKLMDKHR